MKSVLITGGTGSFGNAFVDYLFTMGSAHRIVIYSRDEQKQEIMERKFHQPGMRYFIGDVRDSDRLEFAMRGIDTVIHAAALKIVPTAEYNPTECIATNIGGAENVVKSAIRRGVRKVIALSTDKAVNPVNLYGASKLAAEKIFLAANALAAGECLFSVVRYGNVIGSRGSVLPLFLEYANDGLPLPITDERMTRFWIPMDGAIRLVQKAFDTMRGKEIFVPKIPSIKIVDLATAISPSIGHELVGIRPGEKLHECLITEEESRNTYDMWHHYVISYGPIQPRATKVAEGFRYSSNTNISWLTVEQLRESLDEKKKA